MIKAFNAVINSIPEKGGAYIEIPYDVEQVYSAKRVKVKATFDGIPYRGSIVKMGLPCYMIGITKEIRAKIGKEPGDMIQVTVEQDDDIREIHMPEDFSNEIAKHESALQFFEKLSFSAKRKYEQWITSAKREETRQKRIAEAIQKLESGVKL